MNCEPDGFTGAVLAAQSVKGMKAVVNGPGGCRSRTVNLMREMTQEYTGGGCCRSKFSSGVDIVPCTYLNADDIILGSGGKITEGLRSVVSTTGCDVVLVDTLGATVQVVDREDAVQKSGYPEKVVLTDENLSGMSVYEGFDDTMVRILKHYARRCEKIEGTVNILGYNQGDRSWDYGRREISRLLEMLGLRVGCFVGCDCTQGELRNCGSASLNILVHPEFSKKTAEWMKDELDVPYIIPSLGAPLGFDPIRSFLMEVANSTGRDPGEALKVIDENEEHVFRVIRNYDKFANRVRGYSLAMAGIPSVALPVMRTVYDYFNVLPRSVILKGPREGESYERTIEFLNEIGCSDAIDADVPNRALKMYFTDGYTADFHGKDHPSVICIGIEMPYPDTVPLADRCMVGISGTMNILDEIMNGLREFVCGQPTSEEFR